MPDYLKVATFPLPDDLTPEGTMCVKIHIPADQQYLGTLIGLLDLLKWSTSYARDETKTGAATVARTWRAALESAPIEIEGCDMPEFRINPETCLLEVNCSDDPESPDWQPVITPATDPRTDIPYPPPYPDEPPVGQSNECLAAANISAWVWIACGGWAGQLQFGTFAEFVVLVMGVISGLFTLLTSIIVDNTVTLFTSIDPDTIEADFASLEQQDFIDIIVCYLNPDGTMPAANWGDFLDELLSHAGTNQAWYLVHYCMLLVGWGGVNLLGKIGGITEAECESCVDTFTHTDDMQIGMHGWSFVPFPASDPYDPSGVLGAWESGNGARATASAIQPSGGYRLLMGQTIDPTVLTSVRVVSGFATGTNTTEVWRIVGGVRTQINGSVVRDPMDAVDCGLYGTGANVLFDCGGLIFDELEIYISSASSESWICQVQIIGEGVDPFGA